jgi:hypothetical protein
MFHYHIIKRPPPATTISNIHPVHSIQYYFFKIHFSIIIPNYDRCSQLHLTRTCRFSHHTPCTLISSLPCLSHIPITSSFYLINPTTFCKNFPVTFNLKCITQINPRYSKFIRFLSGLQFPTFCEIQGLIFTRVKCASVS